MNNAQYSGESAAGWSETVPNKRMRRIDPAWHGAENARWRIRRL
jgi:hypothetical protein